MNTALETAKDALESAWVSIQAFRGDLWDTLDDIEEGIVAITGETAKQISSRLWKKNGKFIAIQQHNNSSLIRRAAIERLIFVAKAKASERHAWEHPANCSCVNCELARAVDELKKAENL